MLKKAKYVVHKVYSRINSKLIIKRNSDFFKHSVPELRKLHNKYSDKRCFIIGNGPSLTVEDLERLNDEITIASHGIYYIFDKTSWRPTFYCAQDSLLINERYNIIKEKCSKSKRIFGLVKNRKYPSFCKDDLGIRLVVENFENELPKFSTDAENGFFEGWTVTYFNLQLAVYMGFKEIYLLGIDHFYTGDGNDHFSKNDVCTNTPQLDKSTCAYKKANEFAQSNGIKIFNATRGGHLEVFERVNIDDLL